MVDTVTIDGNRVQYLLKHWRYKGFRMVAIHIEDGYELIAMDRNDIGVSTNAQSIEGALYQLESKIDSEFI